MSIFDSGSSLKAMVQPSVLPCYQVFVGRRSRIVPKGLPFCTNPRRRELAPRLLPFAEATGIDGVRRKNRTKSNFDHV